MSRSCALFIIWYRMLRLRNFDTYKHVETHCTLYTAADEAQSGASGTEARDNNGSSVVQFLPVQC